MQKFYHETKIYIEREVAAIHMLMEFEYFPNLEFYRKTYPFTLSLSRFEFPLDYKNKH